jgi:DNA-binding transcriptional MerR regulator/methylmalonyl-CoA mutase cobalamin-binding subunit
MSGETGQYRIAVVAELTGVPEPTLRAWERRYDIPSPTRSASGYRLYSDREVEQVRRMRALCASGIAVAQAAKLVARSRREPASKRSSKDAFASAADALVEAVERFDDEALDREVRRLPYVGPANMVVERVIVPALRTVGDRWLAGELSVAQEHLVSQKLGAVLRDFLRLAPGGDQAVLVACLADEQHDLGALAVAVHAAMGGVRPVFFGARTPPDALARAVSALHPVAVVLSVTITPERERARELLAAYAKACGSVPWAVGGTGSLPIADLVRGAGGTPLADVVAFERWSHRTTHTARRN